MRRASRGLGHALATRYLKLGYEVWGGCRRPDLAADLVGQGAIVHRLDVTDEQTVAGFGQRACVAGCVDLLINALGVDARTFGAAAGQRGPFELSAEHFLEEVRVNTVGPMLVTRAPVEPLLRSPAAKIVNLSSRTGSMTLGAELCWDIGYNASKAALNAVTVRTAGLLADRGVIVVAMHPGSIRTQMGGDQADLEPADAADQLVATIASLTLDQTGAFRKPDGTIHPW